MLEAAALLLQRSVAVEVESLEGGEARQGRRHGAQVAINQAELAQLRETAECVHRRALSSVNADVDHAGSMQRCQRQGGIPAVM